MAKSGRIERIIGTSGAYTEWLEWVVNSQDIESNKSNITVRFLAARTTGSASNGAYSNYATNKIWLRVGGIVVYENTKAKIDLRTSTGRELATWTGDVEHDSDGKLSLALEGEFYFSSTAATSLSQGNYLVSGTATIDTIPRASSISVTDADIGTDAIITISKASDSFTSTLTYEFKGLTGTIATKTKETVVLFRIPQSFADKMPEKSSKCALKCVTYSEEGNYIGEKIVDFNVVSRDTVTVSGSVTDGNDKTYALTGNRSKLVRYKSTAVVSINATTNNSATISQKTINGQDASSGSVRFENVVSEQFVLYAKNSRRYENQQTISADVVAYVPLTCVCEAVRSDGVSSTATLSVQGDYYNGSFGSQSNSLKLSYKIKESGGSYGSPVTITPTISGGKYTASVQLSNVAYDKQYTVEVTAEDKLTTIADDDIIMKSEPIYWWDDDSFNANVPVKVKHAIQDGLLELNQLDNSYQNAYLRYKVDGENVAATGYFNNFSFVSNEISGGRIGVDDSGNPQYRSSGDPSTAKTLLHAGNVSSYAIAPWDIQTYATPRKYWTSKVKGATWSRLCYLGGHDIAGSYVLLNVRGMRTNVVYNDTFAITMSHYRAGTITKLSRSDYSVSGSYELRLVVSDDGNGYVEMKDSMAGATTSNEFSVYCNAEMFVAKECIGYTTVVSGETVPANCAVAATFEVTRDWENPPLKYDTEYRTTRFWKDKPIYAKLVNMGATPSAGSSKTVEVAPSGATIVEVKATGRSSDDLVCRPFPVYDNSGTLQATIRITSRTSLTVTAHKWGFTSAYQVDAYVEYTKA